MANSTSVRVVLDTNILLSAAWNPDGLEAQIVSLAASGLLTACVSPAVLAEYRDVLFREKFAHLRKRAAGILVDMERVSVHVEPVVAVQAARDEDDNRFLECASAAQAGFLITGNLKDYPPAFAGVRIVNGRQFWELTSKR